jgi:hypothetical protein
MRIRLTIFGVCLAFALFQAVPGAAHLRGHRDPNDTAGADLRWVKLEKAQQGRVLIARARLGEVGASPHRTIIAFDSRRDGRADYYLRVLFDGASSGIYEATLYRADWSPTPAKVRILDDTFQYWFPVSFKWWRLHADRHIRWRVTLKSGETWKDRAPDSGWFRH